MMVNFMLKQPKGQQVKLFKLVQPQIPIIKSEKVLSNPLQSQSIQKHLTIHGMVQVQVTHIL